MDKLYRPSGKRLLMVLIFAYICTNALAQTQWIAFTSHSGRRENFTMAEDGGFGIPYNQFQRSLSIIDFMNAPPVKDTLLLKDETLPTMVRYVEEHGNSVSTREYMIMKESPGSGTLIKTTDGVQWQNNPEKVDSIIRHTETSIIYINENRSVSMIVPRYKHYFRDNTPERIDATVPMHTGKGNTGFMLLATVIGCIMLLTFLSVIYIRRGNRLIGEHKLLCG